MGKLMHEFDLKQFKEQKIHKELSLMEGIYARRSIRSFTFEEVSDHQIHQLISAATQAPSAMNVQPWAFAVIQKPEWLKYISDRSKELLQENSELHLGFIADSNYDIFYGATTLIVIYGKRDGFDPVGDCYLAAENLMLAACGMGLGSCPIGFARDFMQTKEMEKELEIPKDYKAVLPIVIGYPAEHPKPIKRNEPRIFNWIA